VFFSQGALFYLLRNRFYIGEVVYKREICPGPQPALMDRELFEAVQTRLIEQRSHYVTTRIRDQAPLRGVLFDAIGNPMVPTHATKQGIRYRYYVSRLYLRGLCKPPIGAIIRVPAPEFEAAVTKALNEFPGGAKLTAESAGPAGQNSVMACVERIEVRANQLAIWLKQPTSVAVDEAADSPPASSTRQPTLLIPWTKPPTKRFKEILLPSETERPRVRPIKVERRAALLKSIAHGRAWLGEIVSGTTRIEDIAARQRCSVRHVNMTLSMAFIAPALVKAAIGGRLPRGIGVAALRDAPAEWSLQFERLGLARP
jgi:site-specific DNA recombinase